MDINHEIRRGISIITIRGNMSADVIEQKRGEIESMASGDGQKLVLDLKGVDFIDSAGIGAIVFLVKRCRLSGGAVKIAHVQGQVKDVFRMAGLDKALDLYPSTDSALQSYPVPKKEGLIGQGNYVLSD